MQPSSLIFLVIIGIWAAYLLQHWVHRREHLATARSVDRFSDGMHVLERRTPQTQIEMSTPQPRSYAVSPARPSRPLRSEVVVNRATSSSVNVPPRPSAAVRPTRFFHVLAGVSARRLRGLSLLVSLSLALIALPLGAIAALSWWGVVVVLAVLTADVCWLRYVAVSERAAGCSENLADGSHAAPTRAGARSFESESESDLVPVVATLDEPVEADELSKAGWTTGTPGTVEAAKTAEEAAKTAEEAAGAAQETSLADLSGWAPVPVPPPTYTLKAKAERPTPIPRFVELTEYAPVQPLTPDGAIDEDELYRSLEPRRAAGA